MVEISIEYRGGLRCESVHGPSGGRLATDAPVDNHGLGESFSPTDLVATGLGTCMLTTMGIAAKKAGYAFEGGRAVVVKHMTKARPRRIERLEVSLRVRGQGLGADQRADLERVARTCPVALSLLDAIDVCLDVGWE